MCTTPNAQPARCWPRARHPRLSASVHGQLVFLQQATRTPIVIAMFRSSRSRNSPDKLTACSPPPATTTTSPPFAQLHVRHRSGPCVLVQSCMCQGAISLSWRLAPGPIPLVSIGHSYLCLCLMCHHERPRNFPSQPHPALHRALGIPVASSPVQGPIAAACSALLCNASLAVPRCCRSKRHALPPIRRTTTPP